MASQLQNWLLPKILPGVIHEINNPLGVLIMNVSILKEDLFFLEGALSDSLRSAISETCHDMDVALERINGIIKSLGYVSLEKNFEEQVGIDLKYLALHAITLYHTRLKRVVQVETHFPELRHLFVNVEAGRAIAVMVQVLEWLVEEGGGKELKVVVEETQDQSEILCTFTRNGRAIASKYGTLTAIETDDLLSVEAVPDGYRLRFKPHAKTALL